MDHRARPVASEVSFPNAILLVKLFAIALAGLAGRVKPELGQHLAKDDWRAQARQPKPKVIIHGVVK
jgi:hypothetical protein